ncbi:MAG: phytanoyl-CoA dioxygenase family protein [Aquisalimonadaceae bacterium]
MTDSRQTRLTDEEIRTYQQEGLVIPDYRLPEDLLQRMRAEVDDLIERHPDVRPELLSGPHNPWGQSAQVLGTEAWLEFCRFPEILDMVEQLIGPDIILWGSQLFCKPAGHGMAVPWHQDAQYWPIHPPATVTVRIAIEDSLPENACMRYIPGSHHDHQVYGHEMLDRADVAVKQQIPDVDEEQARDDALLAGQISLHDLFLVHGSGENRSSKRRADYAIRYMPASSLYVRDPAHPANVYAASKSPLMRYTQRPLWLVRGADRAGNDFDIGHRPMSY